MFGDTPVDDYQPRTLKMDINALETERWKLANAAIEKHEPTLLEQATLIKARDNVETFHSRVCDIAIKKNSIPILRYLIEHGVSVEHLEPRTIAKDGKVSIPTLDFLLAHGWDINWPGGKPSSSREPFMWFCVNDRDKLVWCLEHGARLEMPKNKDCRGRRSPPILEIVARQGDSATFEFLRSKGAPLRPYPHINKILHAAVQAAACVHDGLGDPENDTEEQRKSRVEYAKRMDMVRYLIDVVGFNVNAPDQSPECTRPRHGEWGTPLECVHTVWIEKLNPRELTWLLLDRGADPSPALKEAKCDDDPTKWHHDFIKNVEDWETQGGPERLRQREEEREKEHKCCMQ